MRTSISHPLHIAEIVAGPEMGKVGLTLCPGKKHKDAATGPWDRDIKIDFQVIGRWNAAAVVTLIEEHEMEGMGVPRLGNAVIDDNMIWHYLPIRDGGVPDARFEEIWESSGAQLRSIVRDGFNVLIHCKGGLGRAGTVAARLLIELGMNPGEAVRSVREARPGAIENHAQLDHMFT